MQRARGESFRVNFFFTLPLPIAGGHGSFDTVPLDPRIKLIKVDENLSADPDDGSTKTIALDALPCATEPILRIKNQMAQRRHCEPFVSRNAGT